MKYDEVEFDSQGVECAAWHFTAAATRSATPAGRPVVVMAHGLAGTKDSGLAPFAEALAAAGLDVLAFDYRGFGASAGQPAPDGEHGRPARGLPGGDGGRRHGCPASTRDRLVLWGVSLSGGHVFEAAAGRDDVAAVVALTPLVDGIAAGRHALASHAKTEILRSTVAGVRGRAASRVGRPAVTMPVVGRPGELAALTLDGCYEDYLAIAGPTWRNEIDAAVGLELGGHRPGEAAQAAACPVLVQIADFDRSAPPQAAAKAAVDARAEVRHYPCDHFDVWPGKPWFDSAVAPPGRLPDPAPQRPFAIVSSTIELSRAPTGQPA